MDPENYSGWGWMRDNFVCWEGEGGSDAYQRQFYNEDCTIQIFQGGGGGGRDLYPFNPPINIKSNQTEIF